MELSNQEGDEQNLKQFDRDRLEALLNAVGEGITVQEPSGGLIWANQAAADLCGFSSPAELIGARPEQWAERFQLFEEAGRPLDVAKLPGRLALAGLAAPELLVQWVARDTGRKRWFLIKASAVHDQSGAVAFVVNVFREVTQRQRAIEALRRSEERYASLYKQSANTADTLSKAFLPADLPEIPGVDLASWFSPAGEGIGGDFYDAVQMRDEKWLITIADVSGKGATAAGLSAVTRHGMRILAPRYDDVCALLEDLNESLIGEFPDASFCSAASVKLDITTEGAWASVVVAGHPKPLVVRRDATLEVHGNTGLPLGSLAKFEMQATSVFLYPGDCIVLCTDGCVGEGARPEKILASLADSAGAPASVLAKQIEMISEGVQPGKSDDRAALVAKISG